MLMRYNRSCNVWVLFSIVTFVINTFLIPKKHSSAMIDGLEGAELHTPQAVLKDYGTVHYKS